MGVTGFLNFIKTKHPHLVKAEHLSLFAHTRVFVDISSYIYKYMCVMGKENGRWIFPILNLALVFKNAGVHFVPVFDGKPPSEKGDEIDARREKREKTGQRIERLTDALKRYDSGSRNEEVYEILEGELKSLESRKGRKEPQRLLYKSTDRLKKEDLAELRKYLEEIKRQQIHIREDDVDLLKKALIAVGVYPIQAPCESEDFCCALVKQGYGRAVISCDSDCLILGAENLILTLDSATGAITYINVAELLGAIELDEARLRDAAILMGCDYNRHAKVNKCGPVGAINYMKKFGSIEAIPDGELDKDCLSYEKCRELFGGGIIAEEIIIPALEPDIVKAGEVAKKWGIDGSKIFSLIHKLKGVEESVEIVFNDE
jgi:5'-3' exonuclease